ncbi:MAG: SMC-Scp complex subunit ScpB [Anaerolineales bacterium]|nr:SMC-Scp complex subunit ScpB [Anaerolineales bacterium]
MDVTARVEALLFVSSAPVSITQLANTLSVSTRVVEKALDALDQDCARRGLRLQRHRSKVQFTTAPEFADDIERFLQLEGTTRLTRAALEVLSIVAYQQPVTRPQIDSIRGVNSDSVLRTLLRHGLIEETGRSESLGRPILYGTTTEFLQQFGIKSLEEMPTLNLDPLLDSTRMSIDDSGGPRDQSEG